MTNPNRGRGGWTNGRGAAPRGHANGAHGNAAHAHANGQQPSPKVATDGPQPPAESSARGSFVPPAQHQAQRGGVPPRGGFTPGYRGRGYNPNYDRGRGRGFPPRGAYRGRGRGAVPSYSTHLFSTASKVQYRSIFVSMHFPCYRYNLFLIGTLLWHVVTWL
jgi:5'-3' exoribonuclease 1